MAAKIKQETSFTGPPQEQFDPLSEMSANVLSGDVSPVPTPVPAPAAPNVEIGQNVAILKNDSRSISLSIPMRDVPDDHYRSRYINIPGLTAEQANAAKALFEGLHFQQARLSSGRYVKNVPDAIRYLLERMSEGLLQQLQK